MKTKILYCSILLFTIVACKKQIELNTVSNTVSASIGALQTDTIKIPLTDMGSRTYMGYEGYLYPNATNTPSGQYAEDLKTFALSIAPLDSFGVVNTKKGKIGFIAIGASTCGIMMNGLIEKTQNNPLTNPYLRLATCVSGGASINEIMNPNDPYWGVAMSKLKQRGLNFRQVQVVYIETDDSTKDRSFPVRPLRSKDFYGQATRVLKIKFPNIKLVYLTGRTTTFIKPKPKIMNVNAEPDPYYNGWACKFLIQDQINGLPNLAYKGDSAVAPMITWGWYEWADGTNIPRNDGFTWTVDKTSDGLHANEEGADELTDYFQDFLLTDPVAKTWYAKKQE